MYIISFSQAVRPTRQSPPPPGNPPPLPPPTRQPPPHYIAGTARPQHYVVCRQSSSALLSFVMIVGTLVSDILSTYLFYLFVQLVIYVAGP